MKVGADRAGLNYETIRRIDMDISTYRNLTAGHFFSVKFKKKDGSIREMNAHPKVSKYIKGTGKPVTDGRAVVLDRKVLRENLKAGMNRFDAGAKAYRSFYPETIVELKVGHHTYDGEGKQVA